MPEKEVRPTVNLKIICAGWQEIVKTEEKSGKNQIGWTGITWGRSSSIIIFASTP